MFLGSSLSFVVSGQSFFSWLFDVGGILFGHVAEARGVNGDLARKTCQDELARRLGSKEKGQGQGAHGSGKDKEHMVQESGIARNRDKAKEDWST